MGGEIEPDSEDGADDHMVIWQSNWASLCVFLACQTQWRTVAAGRDHRVIYLGFDYSAVDVVLRRCPPPDPDLVFSDLLVMEAAVRAAWNEVCE